MNEVEMEHRLTVVEKLAGSNKHRIDDLEADTKTLQELSTSCKVMAEQLAAMNKRLDKVDAAVTNIQSVPAGRWDAIVKAVVTALVAGLVGYALALAGLGDYNRVNLLMAVIEKRIGVQMCDYDAYVNIAGGMKINEPALDLALVMALISSFKNRVIDPKTIVFGEVGLAGEVRAVSQADKRVQEAKKLGFTTCIMPAVSKKNLTEITGINIIGVNNIKEAEELI